ncbi:MAG: hypothetical protein IJL92_10205 [Thermoguttaceae bacterium]|nr:hypothetical protein [Thermoguttaceae bacterium]
MKKTPRSQNAPLWRFSKAWMCSCFCAAILLLHGGSLAQESGSPPPFDPRSWRDDGFPFQPRHDEEALRSIWSSLETQTTAQPFAKAVAIQLLKQGPQYKGKLLSIEGRLLRADRVKLSNDECCFDLWLLLPDSKRDPVRLIARRAPDGFVTDSAPLPNRAGDRDVEYRHETLIATAVYYRATAYDAGDDLLAAPTLVADTFTLIDDSKNEGTDSAQSHSGTLVKIAGVLVIVAIWFMTRSRLKKNKRRKPGSGAATLAILAAALAPATSSAQVADGAQLWSRLARVTPEEWNRETSDERPQLDENTPESAQRRAIALAILSIPDRLLTSDALLERAKSGDVETIQGVLSSVAPIALNPAEEERLGAENIYRATITLDDKTNAAIYLVKPPTFQAPASFFDRTRDPANASGVGERVDALGVGFGSEASGDNAFLATRLRWRPDDAPLGRLDVDLAAFETVRVYPHDALKNARSKEEQREIARALRWTTADRRPFYGSIAAFNRKDAINFDSRPSASVVALFNEPENLQGAHVRLHGWVRRVNMILVTDTEIKAETGLDRYYQLFLFSNDSQGWPVVLCVPELPEGLETGGGDDYRRELDFDGFFYKTWAYKPEGDLSNLVNGESEKDDDVESVNRWTRAPVLVGRIVRVEPEARESSAPWSPTELFLSFAILACAWIVLRRLARDRRISEGMTRR